MIGYYFSTADKKLRYGDNRVIKVGKTHKVKAPVELCHHGLHASKRVIDALKYAPGPYLWVVELGGEIVHGNGKSVATERSYLRGFNAEKLLMEFARKQALINIEKIKPYTDKYDLIVEWLETGNENIKSAARSAAWSAAETAADLAAWPAAESAAELAAKLAAKSTAESAARLAARSAARSAAESAAKLAAKSAEGLSARLAAWSAARSAAELAAELAAWPAAESAAWSAAETAAESAANEMLQIMIDDKFKEMGR